jgi:hypothetical protein
VGAIFLERHRFGAARIDLRASALDLSVSSFRRARFAFAVEAADQLQRQPCTFVGRQAEDPGKHVGRGHVVNSTRQGCGCRQFLQEPGLQWDLLKRPRAT